jgi:hypothetical protein
VIGKEAPLSLLLAAADSPHEAAHQSLAQLQEAELEMGMAYWLEQAEAAKRLLRRGDRADAEAGS